MKKVMSLALLMLLGVVAQGAEPIKVLIIDGQNNHNWRGTTPIMKQILEEAKIFKVDVATAPERPRAPAKPKDGKIDEAKVAEFKKAEAAYKEEFAKFRPKFSDYQVVVSNYNGEDWAKETKDDFVKFVTGGGGFVCVHAADNAFSGWPEYNTMIGVGGWGGRNEKSGPYIRLREGKFTFDESKGNGGSHGARHEFVVELHEKDHPIVAGLPAKWLHADDELYDRLRGPAKNVKVLATAFADKGKGGSGEHEPMLMTIAYEKGRVFHTTLGHHEVSMKCVGFRVTFARGCEWVATGKVTQKLPENLPSEKATAVVK